MPRSILRSYLPTFQQSLNNTFPTLLPPSTPTTKPCTSPPSSSSLRLLPLFPSSSPPQHRTTTPSHLKHHSAPSARHRQPTTRHLLRLHQQALHPRGPYSCLPDLRLAGLHQPLALRAARACSRHCLSRVSHPKRESDDCARDV